MDEPQQRSAVARRPLLLSDRERVVVTAGGTAGTSAGTRDSSAS
jgi:hypothetical protein